jgi:hypothetical protein
LFICYNNLDDYLINYDRLLYVLNVNSMKNPTFTGLENRWRRRDPVNRNCKTVGFSVRVFTDSARDGLSIT